MNKSLYAFLVGLFLATGFTSLLYYNQPTVHCRCCCCTKCECTGVCCPEEK